MIRSSLVVMCALASSAAADDAVVSWQPLRADSFNHAAPCQAVARQLALTEVMGCEVEAYGNHADRLYLVTVNYGPVEDCPSGCIQRHATAIVRGAVVVDLRPGRPQLVNGTHPYVRELALGPLRAAHVPEVDALADAKRYDFYAAADPAAYCADVRKPAELISRGQDVYWRISIARTECVARIHGQVATPYKVQIDGEIWVPITKAREPVADFSRAAAKLIAP